MSDQDDVRNEGRVLTYDIVQKEPVVRLLYSGPDGPEVVERLREKWPKDVFELKVSTR